MGQEEQKEVLEGEYIHSKTGNIYEYLNLVKPTFKIPERFTMLFTAFCCENKNVGVKVYKQDEEYFYVAQDNPLLHENAEVKVLYERAGILWLRTEDDFHKPVKIQDVYVPRFVKREL